MRQSPQAPLGFAAMVLTAAKAAREALGTSGIILACAALLAGAASAFLASRQRRTNARPKRGEASGKRSGSANETEAARQRSRQDIKERRGQEIKSEARARREEKARRAVNDGWMRMDRERLARMAAEELERQRRQAEEQRRQAERMRKDGRAKDRQWALSILGLDASAGPARIRKAFIACMKANHPDQASSLSPGIQAILSERAKLINIANDILKGK
jgi:flagellar biosynthesis GTPase FlhF